MASSLRLHFVSRLMASNGRLRFVFHLTASNLRLRFVSPLMASNIRLRFVSPLLASNMRLHFVSPLIASSVRLRFVSPLIQWQATYAISLCFFTSCRPWNPMKSEWTDYSVQAERGNAPVKRARTQFARERSSTIISSHFGPIPGTDAWELIVTKQKQKRAQEGLIRGNFRHKACMWGRGKRQRTTAENEVTRRCPCSITWRELPQVSFLFVCSDKTLVATNTCLSQPEYACRRNKTFVETKLCLSRQIFVMAKVLSRQTWFSHDKTFVGTSILLSRQTRICRDKWYWWQLPNFKVFKVLLSFWPLGARKRSYIRTRHSLWTSTCVLLINNYHTLYIKNN